MSVFLQIFCLKIFVLCMKLVRRPGSNARRPMGIWASIESKDQSRVSASAISIRAAVIYTFQILVPPNGLQLGCTITSPSLDLVLSSAGRRQVPNHLVCLAVNEHLRSRKRHADSASRPDVASEAILGLAIFEFITRSQHSALCYLKSIRLLIVR